MTTTHHDFEKIWYTADTDGLDLFVVKAQYERWRLFHVHELNELPDVEWFPGLEGYCPTNELSIFYGAGESFKTLVAIDWACHLAHAGRVVVYLAAEGTSAVGDRIEAWQQFHDVAALPTLHVVTLAVAIHNPKVVEAFRADIEQQLPIGVTPDLLVIDTFARNFVGGDENSAQHMGLFVAGADALREHFQTAVLVLHHPTKDGSSERGSEALRNASFAVFVFNRTKPMMFATVKCDRMKEASFPPDVKLQPKVVGDALVADWPYVSADAVAAPDAVLSPDDSLDAQVRTWLKANPGQHSQRKVEQGIHGNASKIREALKRLASDHTTGVQAEQGENRSHLYEYKETT